MTALLFTHSAVNCDLMQEQVMKVRHPKLNTTEFDQFKDNSTIWEGGYVTGSAGRKSLVGYKDNGILRKKTKEYFPT